MKGKSIIWLIIAAVLSGFLVNAIKNSNLNSSKIPKEGYRIYLEGKTIGFIESKDELNAYINKQQEKLKDKYHVDTIYVPNNIDNENILLDIINGKKIGTRVYNK